MFFPLVLNNSCIYDMFFVGALESYSLSKKYLEPRLLYAI